MATLKDVGGGARLRRLMQTIRAEAPKALEKAAATMALNAAARAPSVQEEYDTLMWGDGNPQGFTGSTDPTSHSDGDGRIRLFKTDEEYLANFIPLDFSVNGLMAEVGHVGALNTVSQYMWVNIDQQSHIESKYPLWQAWEFGGQFHIEALGTRANSERYPLAPSLNEEENRGLFAMDKSIPRKAMYGGIPIAEVVDEVLLPAIKQIVREAV